MRQISAIQASRKRGTAAASIRAAAKLITTVIRLNKEAAAGAVTALATAANFLCCIMLDATGDIRYWYGIIAAIATVAVAMYVMFNDKK